VADQNIRSKTRIRLISQLAIGAVAGLIPAVSCSGLHQSEQPIEAKYDAKTGKLSQLTINGTKDGKPNIFSYMDGKTIVRIETDSDEDGRIDRWEYYGPDEKLHKVGISRSNDGIVDMWLFEGPDGLPAKAEVSTKRDGKVTRTEFFSKGQLARAEEDTDADGRVDKWEAYSGGALTAVSFDTSKSGKPTVTVDYRQEKR
jgi:hypothetical protein